MRILMKAHRARSAVVAGAVVAALATGGLAYGSSASQHDQNSTTNTPLMKGVPGTVDKGTAIMRSRPGVQPSKTVQKGSTAERTPVTRGSAHTAKARDVDMSDRGVKGLKPTRDRGKKGLPAQKG